MNIEFDEQKNLLNIEKHGLSFEEVSECVWEEALIVVDSRFEYKETRFIAFVPWQNRLYNVVFTMRATTLRIISFRKANKRERKMYDERK